MPHPRLLSLSMFSELLILLSQELKSRGREREKREERKGRVPRNTEYDIFFAQTLQKTLLLIIHLLTDMSFGSVSALPFTYVAHLLGIVSVVMVFIWTIHFRGGIDFNSTDTSLIFNVHSALMLLSMVFLHSEAIMAFKALPSSMAFRKLVHLLLHMVALILGIVGILAAFKHHNIKGINHLYSLHSWLGIITMALYGLQWLVGFISFFFPRASPSIRMTILPWHVFMGLFIYGLSLVSIETGLLEKLTFLQNKSIIARFSTEAMFVNVLGLVVVLLGIFVSITVIVPEHCPANDGYNPI